VNSYIYLVVLPDSPGQTAKADDTRKQRPDQNVEATRRLLIANFRAMGCAAVKHTICGAYARAGPCETSRAFHWWEFYCPQANKNSASVLSAT